MKNNRVSNGIFGKIVRTLGFILLLVGSALYLTSIILENSSMSLISNLVPYANMANNIITSIGFPLMGYAPIAIMVGLLFLVWALRKGLILRLLITVLLVFVLAESVANANGLFFGVVISSPTWLGSAVSQVSSYLNQLIQLSPYVVPGASLLLALFLWGLFANKKPKRFSVLMVRVGAIFLLLAIIVAALPTILTTVTIFTASWYLLVTVILYVVTYVFFVLGSVFGFLGFARS